MKFSLCAARWNAETYAMPASRRIWPETRGKKMAGLTERTERQKASYKITFVYHRRRHRPDYDVDADVDERTDSQGHDKEQEEERERERDWSDDDARERTTKRVTAFCIR